MCNTVTLFLNVFLYSSAEPRSASRVPVVLCFSFARCSPLFTFSNPLKLSLPLSVSPIVRPSLTLLVYAGSSFHSLCLPTSPLPSPYHFLIPTFSTIPPRVPPSLSRASSAAVVYIHIAPATTCWFSCWRAAQRVIRITARTPAHSQSIQIQFPSLKLAYFF